MGTLALAIIATAICVAVLALAGVIQFPKYAATLFASRIDHTVGSVKISNSGSAFNSIGVHVLGGSSPPKWIGITIQNENFATGKQVMPVTLTLAEAQYLSDLLATAAQQ